MNCHNYHDHLGNSYIYTVAGNFLPITHGMLHGVDEIVDACMNICPACTMGYICNRNFLLSDIHEKVHKVTTSQMFSWSVRVNVCIKLDNDWTHK